MSDMNDNPDRPVDGSLRLYDLIGGFAGSGGDDDEIREEFEKFFAKNRDIVPAFRAAYLAMMNDGRFTFCDKCAYFLSYPGLDEEVARQYLRDIWTLATGEPWPDK